MNLNRYFRSSILICTLLLFSTKIYADEFELTPREKFLFHTTGEVSAVAHDIDTESSDPSFFKHKRFQFGGYAPVYSRLSDVSFAKYSKIGLDGGLQRVLVDTNLYDRQLRYNNMGIGLTYWALTQSKELLFMRFGYNYIDESSGASLQNLMSIVFSTYRFNSENALIYGLYSGYILDGRLAFLPVLGVNSKLSDHWTLKFILPLHLSATYKANKQTSLVLFLKPDSLRLPIENESQFAGRGNDLLMRSQRVKTGAEVQYQLTEGWQIAPEAGFIGRQRNEIVDNKNIVASSRQAASGYLQINLQYSGL